MWHTHRLFLYAYPGWTDHPYPYGNRRSGNHDKEKMAGRAIEAFLIDFSSQVSPHSHSSDPPFAACLA